MPERVCRKGGVPEALCGDSDLPTGPPRGFCSIICWIRCEWAGGDCRIIGFAWGWSGCGRIGGTIGFISGGGPCRPPWLVRGTPTWACKGGGWRWACDPDGFRRGGGWLGRPWLGMDGEDLSCWLGDEFPLLPGDPDMCRTCKSSSFLSLLVIPCSASYSSRTCWRLKRLR